MSTRRLGALLRALLLLSCLLLRPGLAQGQSAAPWSPHLAVSGQLTLADLSTMKVLTEAERAAERERRHGSIGFLEDLIENKNPEGSERPRTMLALADLYAQEGRDVYLSELEVYSVAADRCFDTPGCEMTSVQRSHVESAVWTQKAIALYRQSLEEDVLNLFADEVTCNLARALLDVGRPDEAIQELNRLVETWPDSRYVPEAYLRIGEHYYDGKNLFKALQAYKRATGFVGFEHRAFAQYKLAWCTYEVGEYGKAIDGMKAAISLTTPSVPDGDRATRRLQEEALKDLSLFYVAAGELDQAEAWFRAQGMADLWPALLRRLGALYFEQGGFGSCIQIYRRLLAENPESPSAPEVQSEIVLAYRKMGDWTQAEAETDRLVKSYGQGSAWARANRADPDALRIAAETIEKNLRALALDAQLRASRVEDRATAEELYAQAYRGYTTWLREFPDSPYTYDMRYAFGELLYKMKRFDEAYVQYMLVVEIDPQGQHSRFCAESAIFAADEMIKRERESAPEATASVERAAPAPLSTWQQNMVRACDQWVRLYADDRKTTKVMYKAAYVFYQSQQFTEANERLRAVISRDPASQEAEIAANLILDALVLAGDWAGLVQTSKAFHDLLGLGSPDFKREVYSTYERATLKRIDSRERTRRDAVAIADDYMAFYQEFPASIEAPRALSEAHLAYALARRKADANRTAALLEQLAKDSFASGRFETALDAWTRLVALAPEDPARGEWQSGIDEARRKTDAEKAFKQTQNP